MIVGNGMMAKAFKDSCQTTIFASGVSNSLETNEKKFQREEEILLNIIDSSLLIYFSTYSIYDNSVNQTPYVLHKLNMEELIKGNSRNFLIFRLPQVVGKTNSPTLIKTLFDNIKNGKQFELWINSQRNLIDIDDVVKIVEHIRNCMPKNKIWNIAAPHNVSVFTIVQIIESILNKKANYTVVEKGCPYFIESDNDDKMCNHLCINFDESYTRRIIEKYYV